MKEEKDMLCLSLPFAAAVAVGVSLSPSYALAGLIHFALVLCMGFAAFRLVPRRLGFYVGLMVLCGLFCGFTGGLQGLTFADGAGAFSNIRSALAGAVDSLDFPSPDTGALVKALALGDRSSLSPELKEAFRASGASHILALSGLHLGVFYLCLSYLLAPLGKAPVIKKFKSATIIILTAGYVLLSGCSPSIVRAGLFILLREGAGLLHRKISLLRSVLAALMIQLILSPVQITAAGFQLSYLAVAGIAVLYPILRDLWPSEGPAQDRFDIPQKIWRLCCLSISCQIFTAPVAYIRFGSLPKYFLLANLMALPVAGLATGLSMLAVTGSGAGWCPAPLIQLLDSVLSALVWILKTISTM